MRRRAEPERIRARELSTSDFLESHAHVFVGLLIHNFWANSQVPPLCGIGNQITHTRDPDFVDHVDDKFEFVQAFEIGELRGVTGPN